MLQVVQEKALFQDAAKPHSHSGAVKMSQLARGWRFLLSG
jgi:hypothetical protein